MDTRFQVGCKKYHNIPDTQRSEEIVFGLLAVLVVVYVLMFVVMASGQPPVPQAPPVLRPDHWISPVTMPEGSKKYTREKLTQSISVLNDRDRIQLVSREALEEKYRFSGGLLACQEGGYMTWTSEKYASVPAPGVRHWIATIQVKNSFGHFQPNRGVVRKFPTGTRFDDVLSYNDKVFEHRTRTRTVDGWTSAVLYENIEARPKGYAGLKDKCSSCHGGKEPASTLEDRPGSGGYAVGLLSGGDGCFSFPMDWSVAAGLR